MRTEANRRGRGAEKRAEAKQRGPREGAGASRAESKTGSDRAPCRRRAQDGSKRKSRSAFRNLTGTKQMEQPRRNAARETAAARHVRAQRPT